MFKYLIRRLRYGMAGKAIMLMKACISAVIIIIVLFIFLSGTFSQKQLFFNLFKTFYDTAEDMGEQIDSGNTGPFSVTDEGIYFKGHEKGNKIDLDGKSENDKSNKENENNADNDENKSNNDENKEEESN